jgi:hypothetical protein
MSNNDEPSGSITVGIAHLCSVASLERDLLPAGYFSYVVDLLAEGSSELLENDIEFGEVSGRHSLGGQSTYAIFQAAA